MASPFSPGACSIRDRAMGRAAAMAAGSGGQRTTLALALVIALLTLRRVSLPLVGVEGGEVVVPGLREGDGGAVLDDPGFGGEAFSPGEVGEEGAGGAGVAEVVEGDVAPGAGAELGEELEEEGPDGGVVVGEDQRVEVVGDPGRRAIRGGRRRGCGGGGGRAAAGRARR